VPILSESIDHWQSDIDPDLPWADDHFNERVSGQPLNPPPSEAWWPHAEKSNGKFKSDDKFSHSYPERLWPKSVHSPVGIRFEVGDLNDVVNLLHKDPYTRQAVVPLWFPEDTGAVHGQRVPCTLFYRFIMRNDQMHVTYSIRSCDYYRHFRNDCYFTVRLLLWVLDQLRGRNPEWVTVRPGLMRMDIGSLHIFENDYIKLFGGVSNAQTR
jgi:thymidylate synthase